MELSLQDILLYVTNSSVLPMRYYQTRGEQSGNTVTQYESKCTWYVCLWDACDLMPLKTENTSCVKAFEVWYFTQGIIRNPWPRRKTPVLRTADLPFLPSHNIDVDYSNSGKYAELFLITKQKTNWGSQASITQVQGLEFGCSLVYKSSYICYRMSVLLNASLNCSVTMNSMDLSNKPEFQNPTYNLLNRPWVFTLPRKRHCLPETFSKTATFNNRRVWLSSELLENNHHDDMAWQQDLCYTCVPFYLLTNWNSLNRAEIIRWAEKSQNGQARGQP